MSTEHPDSRLDARLRDVPLPDGLLDRLRAVPLPDDAQIDRRLCDVAVPPGLVDRVCAAVEDEVIVERLADVPVPGSLMPRLRVVPQMRIQSRFERYAVAASLMLAVSVAWFALLGGLLDQVRPHDHTTAELFVLPLSSAPEIESGLAFKPPPLAPPVLDQLAPRPPADPLAPIEIELAMQSPLPPASPPPPAGPAGSLVRELTNGLPIAASVYDLRLTSPPYTHYADDDLPDLEPSPELLSGGFEPPAAPGFDRVAYFLHGVFPEVAIDKGSPLRESHPPLSTRTTGVERLRRQLEAGRMFDKHDIRVEDFLASLDYHFAPADERQLEIRTAAGPSEFSNSGAGLLQVGVKAGQAPRATDEGVHLIVALDVSASMRWRGRLDWCRDGLRRTLAHLAPDDRLTILAFNDGIVASAESVSSEQAEDVYRMLDGLHPHGHTNLANVLQDAVALGVADHQRQARIVLVTDGPGELPDRLSDEVAGMLRSSADEGVQLSVIELSDGFETDPHLEQMAVAGGGLFYLASNSQHIRWTLVETLSGRSSLVAADAKLEVRFNPQAVYKYRLLGHEQVLLGDLADASVTADLHSGEEASVLYEVWLKPGADDEVAQTRVEWRDPATGKVRRSQWQRISRLQFALAFDQSRISLQAAALAAEAAEVLRGSPYVEAPSHGLQDVLNRAEQVPEDLSQRPDFQRFVELLRQAERSRIRRPAG